MRSAIKKTTRDNKRQNKQKQTALIVPTPLEGGDELYTQLGFFVQTILADRYIHRREM